MPGAVLLVVYTNCILMQCYNLLVTIITAASFTFKDLAKFLNIKSISLGH